MKCKPATHFFKKQDSVSAQVQDAKETERAVIASALLKAQLSEFQRLSVSSPEALGEKLRASFCQKTNKEKIFRELLRIEAREKRKLSQNERAHLQSILSHQFVFKGNFQEEYNKLVDHIVRIGECIQKGEHVAFLFEMRKALDTAVYDWIKQDEMQPAVHFLHALIIASYAEPRVLKAFCELGEHLRLMTIDDGGDPQDFPAFFRKSRLVGHQHGLLKNDLTPRYVVRFFRKAWGSLLSITWGRWLTSLLGFKKYDPRGDLENNAGALYDELLSTGRGSFLARTIYTPTPTVGDEVSLEAKALLQALENRGCLDPELLKVDPYPYVCWCYVNLQNYNSADEGPRSIAVMRLNKEYPLSFSGITVAVNSPFYSAGVHGRDEKKIEALASDAYGLTIEYKEAMKNELLQPVKAGGYYFPDKSYQVPLDKIVEHAYRVVIDCPINREIPQKKWNWYQKAAFRELVILGVMRFHVAQCALRSHADILVSYACKESMDRGGKINAAFLWALGSDTLEFQEIVFSALHGRSLLSRGRLILADRLEPLFALQIVVSQPKVHEFLHDIAQSVGVHSKAIIPLTD